VKPTLVKDRSIKRIVFIEPRPPDRHVFSRYPLPRLGPLILGAMLEREGRYVKVYVEDVADLDLKEVFKADLVGISTITSTAPRAYEIADLLRKRGVPVMIGGVHATFLADEALEHADYVLRGEAEDSLPRLIAALEEGRGLEDVPGLSFRVGGHTFHNPGMGRVEDLDSLPIPDFSMLMGKKKIRIYPVMTSRGCPFNCNFCTVTEMFGHNYRYRSKESVLRELRAIPPGTTVFFYDDNFTANTQRTKELLRMMIEEGITPHWTAQVRVDVAKDPELLDLMKRSGCFFVYIGFESVNPATLKAFNKRQSIEQMTESIAALHNHSIRVHGMFVLGSDEDDLDTIKSTVTFAKKQSIDTVQFMILTPLPGSEQYNTLVREDRLVIKDWSYYDAHHVVYQPKKLTYFELQWGVFKAFLQFYSRSQIMKMFFTFNFMGVVYRFYGFRLTREWIRRNKRFIESTRRWSEVSGRINLSMRRMADDIRARVRQLVARGELKPLPEGDDTTSKKEAAGNRQ